MVSWLCGVWTYGEAEHHGKTESDTQRRESAYLMVVRHKRVCGEARDMYII